MEKDEERHNHELPAAPEEGDPERFVDDWKTSSFFERQGKLLKCPSCSGLMRVARETKSRVCARGCGGGKKGGEGKEELLFLTTTVAGVELYAYNREHLNYIRRIVSAKLRCPTPYSGCPICQMSIMRKLPKRLLKGCNRDKVLHAIDALEEQLTQAESHL